MSNKKGEYKVKAIVFLMIFAYTILVVILMLNYILKSIFFIIPMEKKYKIMSQDLSNGFEGRYVYILISTAIIIFYLILIFNLHNILFYIVTSSLLLYIIYKYKKYQKYNILNYVNEFSKDLFDWYKIYELNIDDQTKRNCFKIHNINYKDFKNKYIKHLSLQKELIDTKFNRIDNEP